MNNSVISDSIVVPEYPIEADYGQWLMEHPECDLIADHIGTGTKLLIYAYATSKEGNKALRLCRDEKFDGKTIFKGVSVDGLSTLIFCNHCDMN